MRPAWALKAMSDLPCPVVTIDGPSGSGKGTISRAVATNPGNEVATLATSRTSIAARALRLATAKAMAMR